MNRPRHGAGGLARSAGGTTARGIVIIVAAVAVGIFLLNQGANGSTTVEAGATTTPGAATTVPPGTETTVEGGPATTAPPADGSTPTTATDGTTATTTSDSLAGPRPPSEVKVQVANAARVPGAAGVVTDQLSVLGYAVGTPTNYTGTETLERTRIHYRLGYLQEAMNLATSLNLDPSSDVFDMPEPLPVEATGEDPDLLVLLGTDLAPPA